MHAYIPGSLCLCSVLLDSSSQRVKKTCERLQMAMKALAASKERLRTKQEEALRLVGRM